MAGVQVGRRLLGQLSPMLPVLRTRRRCWSTAARWWPRARSPSRTRSTSTHSSATAASPTVTSTAPGSPHTSSGRTRQHDIYTLQYLHNIYNIRITATRAISAGEELTVSYDQSVGYGECGEVIIIIIIMIILVIITVNRWRWWRSSWRSAASTGWRRDRPASPCPS